MTDEELLSALRRLYEVCEAELRRDFDRSLPFSDTVFRNRWIRAKHLGFSEGASIYDSALVFGDVEVGENTWIGPYALLDGSGGKLSIGRWCSIATSVQIYTHDTVLRCLSGGILPQRAGSVKIGNCCYIGSQSIIAAGVNIGNQCVVAANSFVNKDVPDRTIVGGNPARILGQVEGEKKDVRLIFGNAPINGRNINN